MRFSLGILLILFTATAIADEKIKVTITNCAELQNMSANLSGNYELSQNVDCAGIQFIPIGGISAPFSGTLNGHGHEIKNLLIRSSSTYSGLFGVTNAARIEDIIFTNADISGSTDVGTVAGLAYDTDILAIQTHGKIISNAAAGGGGHVGGLVGLLDNYSTISDSFSTMDVTGNTHAGGLVGFSDRASIARSYATGIITGGTGGSYVAGLVGRNGSYSSVTDSYATGRVNGNNNSGGLIGGNEMYASVTRSYATGDVTGIYYVGGLIGESDDATITDTYSTGSVTSTGTSAMGTGGLIGYGRDVTITNSYATGAVRGATASTTGGLMGAAYIPLVRNSYWDIETTGQTTSVGGGIGKTTVEMRQRATYVDWNFDTIWSIRENETYPWLGTEEDEGIETCAQLQEMLYDLEGVYELSADLDCAGIDFIPVGTLEEPFEGHLNGNGHTISNLNIRREDQRFVGLFAAILGARIENLKIDRTLVIGRQYVGTVAGFASDNSHIVDVHVRGNVDTLGEHPDKSQLGGLVGMLSGSTIHRSSADVDVNGFQASFVGGLVGENSGGTIENSASTGDVYGYHYVGGLIGYSDGGRVTHTYAANSLFGYEGVGGLIGGAANATVTSSYWDIETSWHFFSAGGLGKTTAEMRRQSTYVGWDFVNVWAIEENQNYPYLREK